MKLSIIIPVYNVENYISECLNSIQNSLDMLNENYRKQVEIIIVNDGSTDSSKDIMEVFCKNHIHFTCYSKENGGMSDARNFGLDRAVGKYIGFIDSDDYIDDSYFLSIFEYLDLDLDLIIFDWEDFYKTGERKLVKGIEIETEIWTVNPSVTNKIFKKSLFNNVVFSPSRWYEDAELVYKFIYFVSKYKYIDKKLYNYRRSREGSVMSTTNEKINDIYMVMEDVYNFYSGFDALKHKNIEGLTYQYIKLLLWSNAYRQLKFYKLNIFGFINKMKYTRDILYLKFPDWKSNRLLKLNEKFFYDRLGKKYINNLDSLGKDSKSTLFSLSKIIYLNRKRK